jgi:hypothetical protein
MKTMAAKVGLSDNRIFAALCVQADCIPEVQILCIAGVFPRSTISGSQWSCTVR